MVSRAARYQENMQYAISVLNVAMAIRLGMNTEMLNNTFCF